MKKTLALTSLLSVVVAGSANAAITDGDISAINDSINMVQSDGNYTPSTGNYNVATTDYSTSAGFGLYTYDHDNNPDTPEEAHGFSNCLNGELASGMTSLFFSFLGGSSNGVDNEKNTYQSPNEIMYICTKVFIKE